MKEITNDTHDYFFFVDNSHTILQQLHNLFSLLSNIQNDKLKGLQSGTKLSVIVVVVIINYNEDIKNIFLLVCLFYFITGIIFILFYPYMLAVKY